MKKILTIGLLIAAGMLHAQEWQTYFAYNNVTQIAMSANEVFALTDGSLYSVTKNTEQLHIYNNLHATGISCIFYDNSTEQLLVAYTNGKIDIIRGSNVEYVGDLYDKDMVQQKTIYNITVSGHTAYLSTHYGVQTFDLIHHTLIDSYWIRPDGIETTVSDVVIENDSIFAFTTDSMFSGCLKDNLSDYRYWYREQRSGRKSPDPEKGIHYRDLRDDWYAGGSEGIKRITPTETLSYKPLGPLNNIPYRMTTLGQKLYVVPGGRWDVQYYRDGAVMIYEDGTWTNISTADISPYASRPIKDFMNVAPDPRDPEHFWVTSYGTGLYEFRGTQVTNKYLPAEDNTLGSAVASNISAYTRLDFAQYDASGNLWLAESGRVENQLVAIDTEGGWHGIPLMVDGQQMILATVGGFLIDNRYPNYKWIGCARGANIGLYLIDDNGTPFDTSDDRTCKRDQLILPSGMAVSIQQFNTMMQDHEGRIWIGMEQGIIIVDTTDYFTTDHCLRPELMDNNGENPLESLHITALCQDTGRRVWVGTETLGVYVINEDATEILAHYTTENSPMLSNAILSVACDTHGMVYIGTGEGLVSYKDKEPTEDITDKTPKQPETETNYGSMQQWRLHFSYSDPQEIAATPSHIYVLASGALYSLDRKSEEIEYWSKANGLTGSAIAHIAYDDHSQRLIIAYTDGRIDMVTKDGDVIAMPDLFIKASSVSPDINAITTGKKSTYMSMSFGILAINPGKAEVTDTYYIGEDASSVEVKQVVEIGDSLYALSNESLYSASLNDNLVDYNYWHKSALPKNGLTHAVSFNGRLYVLLQGELYYRLSGKWQKASIETFEWIRAAGGQLLAFMKWNKLLRIDEENNIIGLTGNYNATDAVYTQGQYWLTPMGEGLVMLDNSGDALFRTEGPNSNFSYNLTAAHNRIYSVIGGRWASEFWRNARMNIFDGTSWLNIHNSYINSRFGVFAIDPVSTAVDPLDPGHFFVASYGTGVLEFRNFEPYMVHDSTNSTLRQVNATIDRHFYTRTDGATMDAEGNLWVMNATKIGQPLHVYTKNGLWHAIPLHSQGENIFFTTPSGIHIDYRNPNRKWMMDQRHTPGVILFDDGGTPLANGDDRCIKRSSWVDQDGKTVTPEYILCLAQDLNNRIWIGTQAGIVVIPSATDFFTSNSCHRIIIPRNDGTNLGDYLLGNERINCMAVDGGNRMWIGTENSGLYLIEDDTITVAHFTENNSLLPSNTIQSIAIQPTTGEVFVGTSKGLASYLSDASESREDLSNAYAFPNPVRPGYEGIISVAGLMDKTVVNIVDAGGNLVCKTKSHGGTAVWDGKLPDGRRATPGVYSALCNEPNGKHTVVKILVIR